MNLLEELSTLGVNTEEALVRMNRNVSLYERMLVKFADMMKNSIVQPDFDCNDYADIMEAAHAVKGVSGNLSITPVYEAYSEIMRLLRAGQPEQAKEVLEGVIPIQTEIINCNRKTFLIYKSLKNITGESNEERKYDINCR